MNVFTNNKKVKKFVIILVLVILFNFLSPINRVQAANIVQNAIGGMQRLFLRMGYWFTVGIYQHINNFFVSERYKINVDDPRIPILLTPESIIKGNFIIFDANIFTDLEENSTEITQKFDYEQPEDGQDGINGYVIDGKTQMRKAVAGWYYNLRNFAIVALLSVLAYVAIRMIMSTLSQDKAKYRAMFKDWLVALCLLIVMHYIMIAILQFTSMITNSIASNGGGTATSLTQDLAEKMYNFKTLSTREEEEDADGDHHWSLVYTAEDGETYHVGDFLAWMICFAAMAIYSLIFAVKYLKREFTIIFLILLGPISCITYPIDKISDGKAQAFNKWLTEFIYQVLIQPFHLLLYIVLIGTATTLASHNLLYCIVCFAVMIPAEKFVKSMFGFKDSLGSPLSNMMKMDMFRNLTGGGSSSGGSKPPKEKDVGELEPDKKEGAQLPGSSNREIGDGESDTDTDTGTGTGTDINSSNRADSNINNNDDQSYMPEAGTYQTADGGVSIEDGPSEDMDDDEAFAPESGTYQTTDGEEVEVEGSREGNYREEAQGEENQSEKNQKGGWAREFGRGVRRKYNGRLQTKYGNIVGKDGKINRKKLAKMRAWRMAKGMGKFAGRRIKGATTIGLKATGALVGGVLGAMVGQSSAGAAFGMRLGGKAANSVNSWADRKAETIGDYVGTGWNRAWKKSDLKLSNYFGVDEDKQKYFDNPNQIKRAQRIYKDIYGKDAISVNDWLPIMNEMYRQHEIGVSDADMRDTITQLHEIKDNLSDDEMDQWTDAVGGADELKKLAEDSGFSNERDFIAEAKLNRMKEGADTYSDRWMYNKEEHVKDMIDSYGIAGHPEITREIIKGMAKRAGYKGGKLDQLLDQQLGARNNRTTRRQVMPRRNTPISAEEQLRANDTISRLKGLSDSELEKVAQASIKDNKFNVDEFDNNADYILGKNEEGKNERIKANEFLKGRNNGKSPTQAELNKEMYRRLMLKKAGIDAEKFNEIRKKQEDEKGPGSLRMLDAANMIANNSTKDELEDPSVQNELVKFYTEVFKEELKTKLPNDIEAERVAKENAEKAVELALSYKKAQKEDSIEIPLPIEGPVSFVIPPYNNISNNTTKNILFRMQLQKGGYAPAVTHKKDKAGKTYTQKDVDDAVMKKFVQMRDKAKTVARSVLEDYEPEDLNNLSDNDIAQIQRELGTKDVKQFDMTIKLAQEMESLKPKARNYADSLTPNTRQKIVEDDGYLDEVVRLATTVGKDKLSRLESLNDSQFNQNRIVQDIRANTGITEREEIEMVIKAGEAYSGVNLNNYQSVKNLDLTEEQRVTVTKAIVRLDADRFTKKQQDSLLDTAVQVAPSGRTKKITTENQVKTIEKTVQVAISNDIKNTAEYSLKEQEKKEPSENIKKKEITEITKLHMEGFEDVQQKANIRKSQSKASPEVVQAMHQEAITAKKTGNKRVDTGAIASKIEQRTKHGRFSIKKNDAQKEIEGIQKAMGLETTTNIQ